MRRWREGRRIFPWDYVESRMEATNPPGPVPWPSRARVERRDGPKSNPRGAGAVQRLRRASCRGGGGRDARTKAGRRRAAATRLMSERRRGCLYVLATRRPWAEGSHNFVQRRRRPARPALPKKGSRRAPARPPPYIAAPTPRYARRRRERPVGHEAEGMCLGVPTQPRRRAARRRRATHTHKARRRRHTRAIDWTSR